MEHWDTIRAERLALADQLEGLDAAQWDAASLCAGWRVREVVGHLVYPHRHHAVDFLVAFALAGGRFGAAADRTARQEGARPAGELVADLRRHAGGRFAPPGVGSVAPLTDVLVHGQDIRVPLGLPSPEAPATWVPVLEFLRTPKARVGFLRRSLPRLRYVATDAGWAGGAGPEVAGPAGALALTLLGRRARFGELSGDGLATLDAWAGTPS